MNHPFGAAYGLQYPQGMVSHWENKGMVSGFGFATLYYIS
jgi:hypothetical protein